MAVHSPLTVVLAVFMIIHAATLIARARERTDLAWLLLGVVLLLAGITGRDAYNQVFVLGMIATIITVLLREIARVSRSG